MTSNENNRNIVKDLCSKTSTNSPKFFRSQRTAPQFRLWSSIVSLSSCSAVNLILTKLEEYLSLCVCRASVGKTREKEKMELVNLGGFSIARVTLEPGWSWEKYVKPQEKTDSCQVSHTSLILSGRLRTIMDDGTVIDRGPGDVGIVPPGHNTWLSEMNMHRNRLLRDRGVYQGT